MSRGNIHTIPPLRKKKVPAPRTYVLGTTELIVSCNISTPANLATTRLVPPITWLTGSGSRVKVLHSSETVGADPQNFICNSILELGIPMARVDKSLSCLRMNGFTRDDIERLIDKGPWVLAFDMTPVIPRLFRDLKVCAPPLPGLPIL